MLEQAAEGQRGGANASLQPSRVHVVCLPAERRAKAVERTDKVLGLGASERRFPRGFAVGHGATVERIADLPCPEAVQQIHLDLWVEDLRAAHEEAMSLGARLLKPAGDLEAAEGFQCMPTLPGTRSAFAGADRGPHAAGVASARVGTSPGTHSDRREVDLRGGCHAALAAGGRRPAPVCVGVGDRLLGGDWKVPLTQVLGGVRV